METGELLSLTADLLDALAEATGHDFCEAPNCLMCGEETTSRDVYSFLRGLDQAIGEFLTVPDSRASDAGQAVAHLLGRLQHIHGIQPPAGYHRSRYVQGSLDPQAALQLFSYLKAVSMNLQIGSGWPRIET